MRARHDAKFFRRADADEGHEVLQVDLIRAPRARVLNVGKPLHHPRHGGQLVEFLRGQHALVASRQALTFATSRSPARCDCSTSICAGLNYNSRILDIVRERWRGG